MLLLLALVHGSSQGLWCEPFVVLVRVIDPCMLPAGTLWHLTPCCCWDGHLEVNRVHGLAMPRA